MRYQNKSNVFWSAYWFFAITLGIVCGIALIFYGIGYGVDAIQSEYHYHIALSHIYDEDWRAAGRELRKIELNNYRDAWALEDYCDGRLHYDRGDYFGAWLNVHDIDFQCVSDKLQNDLEEFQELVESKK